MTAPTTRSPLLRQMHIDPPHFFGAGLTHVGLVREENEDSILTDPSGTLWAVADGMGGYGNGAIASDMVIDRISMVPDDALPGPTLQARLQDANLAILQKSREPGMKAMGATAVCMMIQNSMAHIAWAGDCRAYLLRENHMRLLTRDHTVVQDMVDQGLMREGDRESHPEAHVVTRAVGYREDLDVDVITVPLVHGDRITLCSDGLTAVLDDQSIARHMREAVDPHALCTALVTATMEGGAPDNVSVICVFATGV